MLHVVICGENTQFSAVLSTQCCVDCSHWAVHLGHSVTQFCPSVSWHMVGDSESVERLQDSMLSKYGPWLLSWQLLLIPRHALHPSHTKFCGRPRGALCPGAYSLAWSLGERFLCGNRKCPVLQVPRSLSPFPFSVAGGWHEACSGSARDCGPLGHAL